MESGSGDPADAEGTKPGYVLVVGPDDAGLAPACSALREAGFDVMAATEAEVLAAVDLVPPRLLLLDLPEGPSGLAALQRLGAHPPLAGAPLLVLADDDGVNGLTGAVLRGASACLAKPVDPAGLAAAAERLLEWSPTPPDGESRKRRRRPLLLDVEVHERETGRHAEGRLVEASSGGCRLELPMLLEPGCRVRIVLRARGQATHVALGGEVRWAQAGEDGRRAAGVQFNTSTLLVAAKVLGLVDEEA
jgi:twitching motility two-component system response regulator PilG